MKIQHNLFNQFLKLAEETLETVKKELINEIENNTLIRYGHKEDKIKTLEELKLDRRGNGYFNYSRAMGVNYKNGKFNIDKVEFLNLIKYAGVNLESTEYGIFQNENDLDKPPVYKSYNQVLLMLSFCLELQVINEFIEKVTLSKTSKPLSEDHPKGIYINSNYSHLVFEDQETENFFNFLFTEWLCKYSNPKSELSFIFRKFWHRQTTDIRDNDYTIYVLGIDFARYWNKEYKPLHPCKYELIIKNGSFSFKTETEMESALVRLEKTYRNYKEVYSGIKP